MGISGLYKNFMRHPVVGSIVALQDHNQLFEVVCVDNKFISKVWMVTYSLLGLSDGKVIIAAEYDVRQALDPVCIAKWKLANESR